MTRSKVAWLLARLTRQIWIRVVAFAALAIVAVGVAKLLAPYVTPPAPADELAALRRCAKAHGDNATRIQRRLRVRPRRARDPPSGCSVR
ncbi:MAG: hypothetical protein AB7Q81_14150 [Gammaproteobacteria bacterium]